MLFIDVDHSKRLLILDHHPRIGLELAKFCLNVLTFELSLELLIVDALNSNDRVLQATVLADLELMKEPLLPFRILVGIIHAEHRLCPLETTFDSRPPPPYRA